MQQLQPPTELCTQYIPVYEWFLDLNRTRAVGFGISSITFTEMKSYFDLLGIEPEQWELQLLQLFDDTAVREMQKQEKKRSKEK